MCTQILFYHLSHSTTSLMAVYMWLFMSKSISFFTGTGCVCRQSACINTGLYELKRIRCGSIQMLRMCLLNYMDIYGYLRG